MKLALVGIGGAGGRIVEQLRQTEAAANRAFSLGNVLSFDTRDHELEGVPHDQCIRIGDTHPAVGETGVAGDLELAKTATEEALHDIRRVFDVVDIQAVDGVLVVAGFGGGTGSGATGVILHELAAMYDKPLYVLGVLPVPEDGNQQAENAARTLRTTVETADNVILFDNDGWPHELQDDFAAVNAAIATRVMGVFGAGELKAGKVGENMIDSSDIIRTLDTGGVSSIGYAETTVDTGPTNPLWRLINHFRSNTEREPLTPVEIKQLVQRAINSELTLPCDVTSAERTLIVLSGPSEKLSRRGFESARHWLEEETETVEVLAGDEPNDDASSVTASVILSNVTDVPRIDALQEQALANTDQ